MTAVHALIHLRDFDDGGADFKLIGVFSTADKAAEGQAASSELPGFREFPTGFQVVLLELASTSSFHQRAEGSVSQDLYLLYRVLEDPEHGEEIKILGAFLSEEEADEAASAYREGPPEAELQVSPVSLDERAWSSGFITVEPEEE